MVGQGVFLFGFGYLTGLGYGILTREDKIKIDETLQIFSQMKKAVDELSKEMEDKKKTIEKNKRIQTNALAFERDKNHIQAQNEKRQEMRRKIKNQSYKQGQIKIRKTGQYPENYIKKSLEPPVGN